MLAVEAWTPELQYDWMNAKNQSALTKSDCVRHVEDMRKMYGKHWHNDDIDNVEACAYWVRYFDSNADGKITKEEFVTRMKADLKRMAAIKGS